MAFLVCLHLLYDVHPVPLAMVQPSVAVGHAVQLVEPVEDAKVLFAHAVQLAFAIVP